MIFRHFTLPKKVGVNASAPFSWMAEETLIGDVDNLHWTVLGKKGRDVDAVAMDAARLRQWLAPLQAAGLNIVQVLPDAWLLPAAPHGCTVVSLEENFWLRFPSGEACELDATLLPLVLQRADESALRSYGELPAGVNADESLPWQHPLMLIQPQWQRCRVNLLHGAFCQKESSVAGKKGMKAAMVAAGILSLGLLLGPRIAMAWTLVQQENQVQQEIVQLYQHYFPSLHHETNIKYHFGQNLKKQSRGFFLQLDDLASVKKAVPAMGIDLLEYDATKGTLTLSGSAQTFEALQAFVNQASPKFDFTLQPVSKEAPYTAMITGKYK
jgi:general secretion pathway protein L